MSPNFVLISCRCLTVFAHMLSLFIIIDLMLPLTREFEIFVVKSLTPGMPPLVPRCVKTAMRKSAPETAVKI